jgi:hypothetical protein
MATGRPSRLDDDCKPTEISIDGKIGQYLFQRQIPAFLRSKGYKISISRINILCAPAVGRGPPVALWLGSRPLRTPEAVLEWAEARLQTRIDARMQQIKRTFGKKPITPVTEPDSAAQSPPADRDKSPPTP